jgi:hypothetical protein
MGSGLRFKRVIGRFDSVRNKKFKTNKQINKINNKPNLCNLNSENMQPDMREL